MVVQRNAAASVAMVSDDFISHDPNIVGREGLVGFIEWLNAHHPRSHIEVHHEFVSGDLVAIHHTDRHGDHTERGHGKDHRHILASELGGSSRRIIAAW